MIVALAGVAHAQDEVCPGVLSLGEVDQVLTAIESSLDALDGDRAERMLDEVAGFVRCLGEVMPPPQLGRFAAISSVVTYYAQDFEESRRWAMLAVVTTGSTTAGSVSGPTRWWEEFGALSPPPGDPQGVAFPPKGGLVVLDGRALTSLEAASATPHLLQLVDRKGRVLSTRWMDGVAFPEDVIGDEGPPELPRWWVEPPSLLVVDAAPAAPPPAAAAEVVFDGVVSTEGCPFSPDPQDVHARGRRVTIEGHTWSFKSDQDVTGFRDVLRTCGEFRAARRFARWQVASPFSGARAHRVAFVEALQTAEPRTRKNR